MNVPLKKLILVGVLIELIIFIVAYLMQPSLNECFRYSARYSGRLSFTVFLITFYVFVTDMGNSTNENVRLKNWILLFAVLQLIHFGFLATNVVLNNIQLVPFKAIGGILAYLMIVLAPIRLYKLKLRFQIIYFYYVSFVMVMTYVARAKGDFEGAEPFWFHYLAITILLVVSGLFGWKIWKKAIQLR